MKYSGKPSRITMAKYLILLDQSKTNMLSCSAIRRSFFADGESICKIS